MIHKNSKMALINVLSSSFKVPLFSLAFKKHFIDPALTSSTHCQFRRLVKLLTQFFHSTTRLGSMLFLVYMSIRRDFLLDTRISQRFNLVPD